MELKSNVAEYIERLSKIGEIKQNKDDFIKAIRRFMEMKTTKPIYALGLRLSISQESQREKRVTRTQFG